MQKILTVAGKLITVWTFFASVLFTTGVAADEEWEFDLEVYGWLPIIEIETGTGEKGEITRDDILKDLDITAMWYANLRKGRWSLNSDFVYFKISNKEDAPLFPGSPDQAELRDAGLQAWIIRPSVGYTVFRNDQQHIDLYAGARYIWIEVDLKFDLNPLSPGQPSGSRKVSPSKSNWDAVVGVRGSYNFSDKWFIPYSINAGTGQSDSTWEAQAALGYRFANLDAIAGWRYLDYDLGSDKILKKLTVNGPFVGVIFHW